MKRIFYFLLAGLLMIACSKPKEDGEEDAYSKLLGSIAGRVYDQTTNESVSVATVSLSPGGNTTGIGTDGLYHFKGLEPGEYTVSVRKEFYTSDSLTVSVMKGKEITADFAIKRLPAIITADCDKLDFGSDAGVKTRSFKIVNSGYEDLKWEIAHNCPWIQEVKPKSGTLGFGKTETIDVIINRELLDVGGNKTVLVVKSSNGSSQIEVIAIGTERQLPSLNTLEITDVTRNSATLNGKILTPGTPAYTERGFVCNTEPKPTLENTLKTLTAPVTDNAVYSCRINGLTLGTTYYVRAYAKNNKGVAYAANEVVFQPSTSVPIVTIQEVSGLNPSKGTVILNGTVTSIGDPAYTEKGFVYNNQPSPTINDNKVEVDGNKTGTYSAHVTNLSLDKVFYVRAYIRQGEQTFYSDKELNFSLKSVAAKISNTTISDRGINTANFTASITEVGAPEYTEKGFVFNTVGNPQIDGNDGKIIADGTGKGSFSCRASNLIGNTIYYVRAYVIQNGNTYYGEESSFRTLTQLARLNTNPASNVVYTTATLNATVTEIGNPAYNRIGFYYGTNSNPTANNSTTVIIEDVNSSNEYSKPISNLEESTTYYFRAFLFQPGESNPVLGQVQSFKTGLTPYILTGGVKNITCSDTDESNLIWSVTFYGGLIDDGDPACTEMGIVYGKSNQPTINDGSSTYLVPTSFKENNDVLKFYTTASGLLTGTHYYFRAVAKTPLGYVYGEPVEFTPAIITPIVKSYSTECSEYNGKWCVKLRGTSNLLSQPSITSFGFVYGTTPSPKVDDGSSIAIAATNVNTVSNLYAFETTTDNLQADQNYYVRAYVKTQLGYTYGEPLNFKTY